MGKDYDKPKFIEVKRDDVLGDEETSKGIESIKEMMRDEEFAVLATNREDISYTSLISFALDEDATKLIFATPIKSKKFEMIEGNKNVSILVDNRAKNEKSINNIAAITCMGKARILSDKEEIGKWSKILIDRQNYLDDFINAETSSIVLVDILEYYYVTSFQEVFQWNPKSIYSE